MQIRKAAIALASAVLLTTAGSAVDTSAVAAGLGQSGRCTPTWKVVQTPAANDILGQSVSAVSSRDAWFVGLSEYSGERPVWHWNGRSVAETAPIPTGPFFAQGGHLANTPGSFSSDQDGWVLMGSEQNGQAIADRWHNGRWTRIPLALSPAPRDLALQMTNIASISATDAWAFGFVDPHGDVGPFGPVMEHWDGRRWSIVDNPASNTAGARVQGVSVISATDIWAAGLAGGGSEPIHPFTEHWDGTNWSIVATPPATDPAIFTAVSASGPNDVWAVGKQTQAGTQNTAVPLVEHWDGTAWTVKDLPDVGNAEIDTVFASGPNDVWAPVLEPWSSSSEFMHWDGKAWTVVPGPAPAAYGMIYAYLQMGGTGPSDVWAIGTATDVSAGSGGLAFSSAQIIHLSCGKE